MTQTSQSSPTEQDPSDLPHESPSETAKRGRDDRRGTVNPADNPAPSSPEPDKDALRKGEENLDRV